MHITLHLQKKTTTHQHWIITINQNTYTLKTRRNRARKSIDNLRHAIQTAVGPNKGTLRFLGNTRVNGNWVSEWIML